MPRRPVFHPRAAQRGDISHALSLAGQFQPYQVVDVHTKVSGYMKKINVDIGDIVHEGQTLEVLEVPELKAQLQQTVFEVEQIKEEITQSRHEISRVEATHSALHSQHERLKQAAEGHPGLIAQQELDDAQAKYLSSESQVDSAKAAMAAAKQHAGSAQSDNQRVQALHDYTTVTAPARCIPRSSALIPGGARFVEWLSLEKAYSARIFEASLQFSVRLTLSSRPMRTASARCLG